MGYFYVLDWKETKDKAPCQKKILGHFGGWHYKKSRIRETKNLSTDADSRTDTVLERLRDLSKKNIYINRLTDIATL